MVVAHEENGAVQPAANVADARERAQPDLLQLLLQAREATHTVMESSSSGRLEHA